MKILRVVSKAHKQHMIDTGMLDEFEGLGITYITEGSPIIGQSFDRIEVISLDVTTNTGNWFNEVVLTRLTPKAYD